MYPSTLSRNCCGNNSVNLCHHPDFELVNFKVPDKVIILGICFILFESLCCGRSFDLVKQFYHVFWPHVWKKLSGLLAGLN